MLRRPTFPAVLGMLIAVLVLVPLAEVVARVRVGLMLTLVGLTIPILAVAAASDRPRHRRIAVSLAAISVLANGAALSVGGVPLWAGNGASLIFLAYTTYLLLRAVVGSAHVTLEIVAGALAAYVMVGLTWAIAYGVVESPLARLDSFRRRHSRGPILGSPVFQLRVAIDHRLRRHLASIAGRSYAGAAGRLARHGVLDGAARGAGRQGSGAQRRRNDRSPSR